MRSFGLGDDSSKLSLAFSGGGHRATLFSLGVFAYLVDADLAKRTQTISSVSGGSLTNGVIAAFCASRKKSIGEIDRSEWQELIAKLANQISGRSFLWQLAALALTSLAVFFANFLFSDTNGILSRTYLISSWAILLIILGFVRGVYGCSLWTIFFWLTGTAVLCWYVSTKYLDLSTYQLQILVVLAIMLLSFLGSFGRGSFWAYSATWLFFSFVIWGILSGLYLVLENKSAFGDWALFVSKGDFSEGAPFLQQTSRGLFAGILLVVFSLLSLNLRSVVAERSFDRLLERVTGASGMRLGDFHGGCEHVFCATMVEYGVQLHLTKDTAYYVTGSSPTKLMCSDVRVSSAIQMSAAFPGGFPYKNIHLKSYPDEDGVTADIIGGQLVSDGGVVDNSGISWFFDYPENLRRLENLVVVDSSRDLNLSSFVWHKIPIIQDLKSVFGVIGTVLNTVERGRAMFLAEREGETEPKKKVFQIGAKVSPEHDASRILLEQDDILNESAETRVNVIEAAATVSIQDGIVNPTSFASNKRSFAILDGVQKIKRLISQSRETAEPQTNEKIENLFKQVNQSRDGKGKVRHAKDQISGRHMAHFEFVVPTTFRPLGRTNSENCLRRGYCHAMQNMHLVTGGEAPIFERSQSDFYKLTKGIPLTAPKDFKPIPSEADIDIGCARPVNLTF